MKARTKLQIRVVELSKNKLAKITEEQKKYAFKNCLDHKAVMLKSGKITCLDCGHSWNSKSKQLWHNQITENKCPSCSTQLKIEVTRVKNFFDWSYMGIIDTCEEFQVIRLLKTSGRYKSGNPANLDCSPVSEIWIAPNGKFEIIGFNHRQTYGGQGGLWTGDWSLKRRDHLKSHNISPYKMFPKKKVTKINKRNGFRNSFYDIAPYQFFSTVNKEPKIETLLKAKQISLLRASLKKYRGHELNTYWSQIKIAMKNNYIVKDATLWYDYLGFVKYFKCDLFKKEIVCPKDLLSEHNKLMHKKQVIEDELERIREIQKHEESLIKKKEQFLFFKKTYKKYSDFFIKEGDVSLIPFKTINQVKRESEKLNHCAFSSGYHLKKDSLLLSARYKNKVIETVQVCLKEFIILQARGKNNGSSSHHKMIVSLVKKNMKKIRKATKTQKKKQLQTV